VRLPPPPPPPQLLLCYCCCRRRRHHCHCPAAPISSFFLQLWLSLQRGYARLPTRPLPVLHGLAPRGARVAAGRQPSHWIGICPPTDGCTTLPGRPRAGPLVQSLRWPGRAGRGSSRRAPGLSGASSRPSATNIATTASRRGSLPLLFKGTPGRSAPVSIDLRLPTARTARRRRWRPKRPPCTLRPAGNR